MPCDISCGSFSKVSQQAGVKVQREDADCFIRGAELRVPAAADSLQILITLASGLWGVPIHIEFF